LTTVGFDHVFKLLEEHAVHLHALKPDLGFFMRGNGIWCCVVEVAILVDATALPTATLAVASPWASRCSSPNRSIRTCR
jgi:hypothetical protein